MRTTINKTFLIICVLCQFKAWSQKQYSFDVKLLEQLVTKGENTEAILLANEIGNCDGTEYTDSVNYFKGFAFYQSKQFDSAAIYLKKTQNTNELAIKSKILASLNYVYLNRADSGLALLQTIETQDTLLTELIAVEKAGCLLLMHNDTLFAEVKKQFKYTSFMLTNEEQKISDLYTEKQTFKNKSPLGAALRSAIIPGWGKWYCRKKGSAITTFLTVGLLSGIACEQVYHDGVLSVGGIATVSAATVLYFGSIYGSYYLAKQVNNKNEHAQEESIKYYMHVALRNVFF